jgi:hypothetical protein
MCPTLFFFAVGASQIENEIIYTLAKTLVDEVSVSIRFLYII